MSVRLIVVDDQPLFREGLGLLLDDHPEIIVIGCAEDADTAIELALQLLPDVILMDISMPGKTGIEATEIILSAIPECKIIALTAYEEPEVVNSMFHAGAIGFQVKDCSRKDLIESILTVYGGDFYVAPRLAQALLKGMYYNPHDRKDIDKVRLSDRETEIIRLLAIGNNNKEIAWSLQISVKTVETHRASLMRKLNLKTIAELTHYAIATHLVDLCNPHD